MGMTAAFTAPPQFTVISGRDEIGRTDPMLLTERIDGPRLILLAGGLAGDLDRLETAALLRRASVRRREGQVAHCGYLGRQLRAVPVGPGCSARC